MMKWRYGFIWLVSIAGIAASALAQAQAHAQIALGERVSGAASASGGDLYVYFGMEGTRLRARLVLPGQGALTLYGPDGDELARSEGEGSAELSQTLLDDGIYLFGVTRAQAGADYALELDGEVPRIEYVYDDAASPSAAPPAPPAPAASPMPPTPAFVADPAVWGIYTRLAGRRSVPVPGTYYLAWKWSKPGEELVEEWRDGNDRVAHTHTLTPTGRSGELLQRASYLGGKEWLGRIGEDGRVTFVGRGLLKSPYQVEISSDEVFQMRRAKVDSNGQPLSVEPPTKRARWTLAASE
jgi:hypothetical protein